MRMTVQTLKLLQDGGAPEYMYHDRTAWRCAFLWAKNMEAEDIHKEMLPTWAAFLCVYPLLSYFLPTKTHNATLFYRGTCIQGRRHLVTTATSVVMRIPILVRHDKTR
jgi:hypothetical protein